MLTKRNCQLHSSSEGSGPTLPQHHLECLSVREQYRPNRALNPESAFGDKPNFGYLRFPDESSSWYNTTLEKSY